MIIRAQQLEILEDAARQRFETEMVGHSKAFSPRLCEVIGDEQLRTAVRFGIARAEGYGFTNRGPARLFIEMMFLRGSAFDTDPQYIEIGRILRGSGDQMERAEQIHQGQMDYLGRVSGAGNVNVKRALKELLVLTRTPIILHEGLVPDLLREMKRVFPEKAAYIGDAHLRVLVDEARAEARNLGFEMPRQIALLTILKYAFGHGCTTDPLYPWIARTLNDERVLDPTARAERLERKATIWLEHVVARNTGAS